MRPQVVVPPRANSKVDTQILDLAYLFFLQNRPGSEGQIRKFFAHCLQGDESVFVSQGDLECSDASFGQGFGNPQCGCLLGQVENGENGE